MYVNLRRYISINNYGSEPTVVEPFIVVSVVSLLPAPNPTSKRENGTGL